MSSISTLHKCRREAWMLNCNESDNRENIDVAIREISLRSSLTHRIALTLADAGSGNYFRNLVTIGLQIIVTNCVCNYNLRVNQLWVTGGIKRVVARERRLARASRVHQRLAFIERFYRARRTRWERRCGIWTEPYGFAVLHARYYESNPLCPAIRLSESREKVTSILAFLRADVSLYCLCTNDNGRLSSPPLYTRAYTRAFASHAHSRISFPSDSLRRRFRAAPPS